MKHRNSIDQHLHCVEWRLAMMVIRYAIRMSTSRTVTALGRSTTPLPSVSLFRNCKLNSATILVENYPTKFCHHACILSPYINVSLQEFDHARGNLCKGYVDREIDLRQYLCWTNSPLHRLKSPAFTMLSWQVVLLLYETLSDRAFPGYPLLYYL